MKKCGNKRKLREFKLWIKLKKEEAIKFSQLKYIMYTYIRSK